MFISHQSKAIFIHIQKTGGDAIEAAVRRDDPAIEVDLLARRRHPFAREVRAAVGAGVWSSYFRFAFVRNPWDRLVSWYSMCVQVPSPNAFARYVRQQAPTFSDFITRATTGMGERTTWNQIDFLVDDDGRPMVDFVGRYENLAGGFAMVKERLGLTARLPHTNRSSHSSYRDYYTDETKAIVADRYSRDIAHFGYRF